MQKELLKAFKKIKPHYDDLIVSTFKDDTIFNCVLRAAFAKSYEYNYLCCSLKDLETSFFFTPTLRGICEDLIALKYIRDNLHIDRDELMSLLTQKRTFEGISVQKLFFLENKPEQIIIEIDDAHEQANMHSVKIKAILVKNGLKGDKDFPSVAQMATDAKLIKLYDYLYYATSKTVHFEPGLLLKLGWSDSLESREFNFSTKNFFKYYAEFNSYYGAFLFVKFYDAFKKDLRLDGLFKKEIQKIKDVLDGVMRIPEIVTFEECNIRPPSTLTRILNQSARKRQLSKD